MSSPLENLKKEAKRWLKALRARVAEARARLERAVPTAPRIPTLREVQHALARELGFSGWSELKQRLPQGPSLMARYESVAEALVTAYQTGDGNAMRVVWDYFGHMRAWEGMKRYVRLDLGKREEPEAGAAGAAGDDLSLEEARLLVARAQGMQSWHALKAFVASLPPGRTTVAAKPVFVHGAGHMRDWDEIIALMQARRITGLDANREMTDAQLARLSRLEHITALNLEGSRGVSDAGLRALANLPHLCHLNLTGCPITDEGLAMLRRLPELETLALAWTRLTDVGALHLAACQNLRSVNLMGTATGDGAIRALAGKPHLSDFQSGNGVTDAGLDLLHQLPVFKTWQDGVAEMHLTSPTARPNHLQLRGSFTDRGLAKLVGLDGLFALDLDHDMLAVTGAGLAPLEALPHLAWLGFDAKDESMPYIAALPQLRFLMCQDTCAGDSGFEALSRSRTLEYLWGRRCYNLRSRGFRALARMPALKSLSVSCKNVDDEGLAVLSDFPALEELMPMDVPDEGYRFVGKCTRLRSLVLMYCRRRGTGRQSTSRRYPLSRSISRATTSLPTARPRFSRR
ncbi:MAG TPA: hypothetical protein VGQ29_06955 [Gemmatimonadales bacterium]|jgi:hypothetical protein|nr:hypothetical protein [Gemmatimonadales bacterium]